MEEREKEKLLEKAKKWFKRIFYRSSITGKFVNKEFAEENPETTVKETRKIKKKR